MGFKGWESQKPGHHLSWETTPQSLSLGSGSSLALPFFIPKCPEPFPGQLLPQDVDCLAG